MNNTVPKKSVEKWLTLCHWHQQQTWW